MDLSVVAVFRYELGGGIGRTHHLGALADLELDVVDDGAERDVLEPHAVAGLDVRVLV